MSGVAYTIPFKDPEYYEPQYTNIKCEISALALTYFMLINKGLLPEYGDIQILI